MALEQGTRKVKATGRKAAVASANYDQVLNVAPGANVQINIAPPVGELWRIKHLYVRIVGAGGTAGFHAVVCALGSVNVGRNWQLWARSNYNSTIEISRGRIYSADYATEPAFPTTEQAQLAVIQSLVCTNASPLVIFYDNQTTGGTQAGTIQITVTREVEYIV